MTGELAAWAPSSLLAGVLLLALGALWRMFARRLDKMESTLETLKERLPTLVTTTQLDEVRQGMGRLGDRVDGRITNVAERVAVLEALSRGKA